MSRVSVVGSLHLDLLVDAPRLPLSDETLVGRSWSRKCGGKGGNQAVAAARLGATVAMGGRVGDDDFGRSLRAHLEAAGVDHACVGTDPVAGSGMSVAIQEASGEYGAVIVSGANLAIDPEVITNGWATLWGAKVLMLQNEVPDAVNRAAGTAARARGCRVMLNAAPARSMPVDLPELMDLVVMNRLEAAQMSGHDEVTRAAAALHRPGQDLIITLGRDGLHLTTAAGMGKFQPAFRSVLRSAHGAGDFFCGALATRLAAGDEIAQACRFAQAAAALFVARTPEEQEALSVHQVLSLIAEQPA